MCLGVYLASSSAAPLAKEADISVQEVDDRERAVLSKFSLPHVRYIGAHTGCSCGFPYVIAESPFEWFEEFDDEHKDRSKDIGSLTALFALVRTLLRRSREVELYPVWNGHESAGAKGVINLRLSKLNPATFYFTEQFLHRISK